MTARLAASLLHPRNPLVHDQAKDRGYIGRAQYDPGFYVYSGVLLLGAIGWLFIDATRSVVEPEASKEALV